MFSGVAAKLADIPKPLFLMKLADYGVDAFQLKRRGYLMDKDYVKEVIEGLGGAKALMDEMDEYHEIAARMRKERPAWWRGIPTSGWRWDRREL